jgi:lipopolysaccharide export system permease protein
MIFLPVGIFLAYKAANDSNIMDAESYKRFFRTVINKFKKKHKTINENTDTLQ